MKISILPILAVFCLSFTHSSVKAAPGAGNNASTETIMVVERSGKPPFKRTFVEARSVDVAQFETSSKCENIKTVTLRGKPPFKRSTACVQVVDVAQFELSSEQNKTDFSGKPPFKRH